MITWVLVANAAEAHLYQSENLRTEGLQLVKDFSHPDSRKKVTDLISDKPGHYKTDTGVHGAYAKGDPKENEAEHFALELVKALKAAHDQKKYFSLVIITPHHFYGHIKKHFNFHIDDVKHIPKDYTKYAMPKLITSIREQLFVQ